MILRIAGYASQPLTYDWHGTEVAHVTRDSDTTFKVKGQGHQAALLTAFGVHWGGKRRGHIVVAARLQLVEFVMKD